MYALRSTHVSWARRLTNPDSVKLQVGHSPQDIEERHYLDLVDARESSRAVWDVLTRARTLDGKSRKAIPLALAAGAENFQELDYPVDYERPSGRKTSNQPAKSSSQVGNGASICMNASWRTRTSDPVIKSLESSPGPDQTDSDNSAVFIGKTQPPQSASTSRSDTPGQSSGPCCGPRSESSNALVPRPALDGCEPHADRQIDRITPTTPGRWLARTTSSCGARCRRRKPARSGARTNGRTRLT